jgi:hemoglobin
MGERTTVYDFAGGEEAFLTLATALNERCLADPVLNHPFSHATHPQHLERLGWYLGEVFGGPASYSALGDGQSAMLLIHAETGADDDMATRFVTCFDQAVEDAGLPRDEEFRRVLHEYMVWAASDVNSYSPLGSVVPTSMKVPRWSWDGLDTPS